MAGGPEAITPAQREVIQGALAGAQDAGLKIAGLAEVKEVSPTLVGPADDPTDLGPSVELSVTVDADGRPIPRGEARDPGVVGDSVVTIRVTPHADLGGTFWRANVSVHDVETSRLYHGQSSGATPEQYQELVGDRTDAEYGADPDVAEGLLELEAQSPAEAVAQALTGIASGGVIDTHKPWDTPAAAPAAAAGAAGAAGAGAAGVAAGAAGAAGAASAAADASGSVPEETAAPAAASDGPPWLLVGGGVALLLALVVLIGMFTGGTGDEVPVADADEPGAPATTSDDADGADATDAAAATGEDAGLPPAPEGAYEGTLTVTGDDTCGYFGTLGDYSGRAEPSDEGGRLVVSTGSFGAEEISGRLWPDGAGGFMWEDREFLIGEPDSQVLTDIIVDIEEGTITGALAWTDHDGCSSNGTLTLEVPSTVIDWATALPQRHASEYFVEDLTITTSDGGVSVSGVLIDGVTGSPAVGQLLYVQVFGKDGLLDNRAVTTDATGAFELVDAVGANPDDKSLSGSVLIGPVRIASVFVE